MKPIPDLDTVLGKAKSHGVFGTKMRSVIKLADARGVSAIVEQQFAIGRRSFQYGFHSGRIRTRGRHQEPRNLRQSSCSRTRSPGS